MSKRTFTTKQCREWRVEKDNLQEVGTHEELWTDIALVFRAPDDGKFYRIHQQYQHDYGPYEGEPEFEGVEVFPVDRIVTDYSETKDVRTFDVWAQAGMIYIENNAEGKSVTARAPAVAIADTIRTHHPAIKVPVDADELEELLREHAVWITDKIDATGRSDQVDLTATATALWKALVESDA